MKYKSKINLNSFKIEIMPYLCVANNTNALGLRIWYNQNALHVCSCPQHLRIKVHCTGPAVVL